MNITKIKIEKDQTATIDYNEAGDIEIKQISYSGKEKVTDEFKEAFQKAVDGFVACLPRLEKDKSKITMNAIRFDYDKSGKLEKALYSVKYAFYESSNAVVNISTPLLPIWREGLEKVFCINGKYEENLYEILEKAEAYIKGDTRTKQMKTVKTDQDGNVVINFDVK